jgi:RIO-like serine/threonine protein kinase
MTRSVCEDHYQKAYDAALERMKWYVEHRRILHRDVTTFNALLNDTLGDVELVDWGRWIYRKVLAEPLLHF